MVDKFRSHGNYFDGMRFQQEPNGMTIKSHDPFIFTVLRRYLVHNLIDTVGFCTLHLFCDWICTLFMSFDWKDFKEFTDWLILLIEEPLCWFIFYSKDFQYINSVCFWVHWPCRWVCVRIGWECKLGSDRLFWKEIWWLWLDWTLFGMIWSNCR